MEYWQLAVSIASILFIIGWSLMIDRAMKLSYVMNVGKRTESECGNTEMYEVETTRHKLYEKLSALSASHTKPIMYIYITASMVLMFSIALYTVMNYNLKWPKEKDGWITWMKSLKTLFGLSILSFIPLYIFAKDMNKYGDTGNHKKLLAAIDSVHPSLIAIFAVYGVLQMNNKLWLKESNSTVFWLLSFAVLIYGVLTTYARTTYGESVAIKKYSDAKNKIVELLGQACTNATATTESYFKQAFMTVNNKSTDKTCADMAKDYYAYFQHKDNIDVPNVSDDFKKEVDKIRSANDHVDKVRSFITFVYAISVIALIVIAALAYSLIMYLFKASGINAFAVVTFLMIAIFSFYGWISGNLLL